MLKNMCELSYQSENKSCRLLCDNDTPISLIKEALFQFQKYVGAIEDAAKQQEQAKADEQAPIDIASDMQENQEQTPEESKVEELPIEVQ